MSTATEPQWTLHIGCHKHHIMSRDSGTEYHDSREAAIQSWKDARKSWASIGYVVWFAELIAPDGTKELLESNPCY